MCDATFRLLLHALSLQVAKAVGAHPTLTSFSPILSHMSVSRYENSSAVSDVCYPRRVDALASSTQTHNIKLHAIYMFTHGNRWPIRRIDGFRRLEISYSYEIFHNQCHAYEIVTIYIIM